MDVYLNTRRDLLVVKSGCPIPAIAAGGWRKSKKRAAKVSEEIRSAVQTHGYYMRKLRDRHQTKSGIVAVSTNLPSLSRLIKKHGARCSAWSTAMSATWRRCPACFRIGPPVTNIRNTSSPHWRGWLKPENRCLVPCNSFAEYAPEPTPPGPRKRTSSGSPSMRIVRSFASRASRGRPGDQVQANSGAAQRLGLSHHVTECCRRADSSERHARHPDDR